MQTTDYEKQATDFLAKHGIKFRCTLSDSKVSPWRCESANAANRREGKRTIDPHHYRVTLSKGRKGKYALPPPRITFDFWGSSNDAEKGIDPTAYDVLACISSDSHCADTFKDWCADMGESEDSIKALQTFRRCHAFAKRLQAFFTQDELGALRDIQ